MSGPLLPGKYSEAWFRAPASTWLRLAEVLPQPWPREAALLDLELLATLKLPLPSERHLEFRWGWSHGRVHRLLTAWRRPT